ncbi:MAG TPA: hypothetical protein DCP92_07120 [Nitrospiraceae bacterium]|nr:hypothetical protein [Nitrospiraceae bacterium]
MVQSQQGAAGSTDKLMNHPVKLREIIEAIELQSDEMASYFNTKTGQIITISDEEVGAVEEGDDPLDDYPEWQQDNIRIARDFMENEDDYLTLPTKYDFNEYHIMEKFVLSLKDRKVSEVLYSSIKGKGAFRRFKDAVQRLELSDEWYAYRDAALRQVAIDWCESNQIPFKE